MKKFKKFECPNLQQPCVCDFFSKVRKFVGKFREIAEENISHVQHDPLILKCPCHQGVVAHWGQIPFGVVYEIWLDHSS